jgi:tetratricopeptide (TPR) repeat protein
MFPTPPEPDLHAIVAWVRRGQVAFAAFMPHDPATVSTAHPPPPRRAGRRRLAMLLTVLAAGGLGHAGLLYWMGTKPTGRPHEGSSRATTEAPAPKPDEAASELAAGDALLAAAAGPDAEGLSQAARHFAQAVRLRETALAAAIDADARRLAAHALAVALERFGTVDLAQGFFGDAERSLARAEALAVEVAEADLVRSIAARRGEAALAERRPGDAMAHFSRALGDAPSAALLERLALAELAAGEAPRAAATLRRSLALRGDDASEERGRAEALRLLAQAESSAGRHDDGIAALRASHAALVAANASSLERSRAAERIADSEERMGRLVETITALRLALDELDGEDLTRSIDLTLRLGQAAAARGDRSGAREAAADALALAERSGGIDDPRRLRIGDLLRDAGDLDGAAEAYRSALGSMQATAVAAPDDAELARDLARAQVRVAALALLRERPVEATAFADRARKTLAAIVDSRRDPEPTLTSELAAVDQLLGDIALADGRFEDAVRAYGRARGPRRIAVDRAPDSLAAIDDLGETLASLGAVALRIGRIEVAIRHLEERRALQASIAERPGAPIAALRGHASALDRLANALLAAGDSAGAVATFERSLAVREAMRDRDPEGPTTLDSLADAHEQLASMLVIRNDLPAARRHADESLALRRRVLAMMPDDDAAVAAIAGALARHGDIAFALGDLDGAEASHRAALEHRLNAALRRPTDEALRRDVAVSHCNIGRVVGARGQAREAIERFEEAERLLKTIARRDGADDDLREDLDTVALALERMRSAESASP